MNKGKKNGGGGYILYARKSTEGEEKQVESINDQIAIMRKIAKDKGIKIVKEFKEAKSAKAPGKRKEFDKMMELISTGKYDGIIAWDSSRLSRNPADSGNLQWALRSTISRIIFHDRECTKGDNIMLSVTSALDTEYIDKLRDNVTRGMTRKASERHIPPYAIPPLGYKTGMIADDNSKSS